MNGGGEMADNPRVTRSKRSNRNASNNNASNNNASNRNASTSNASNSNASNSNASTSNASTSNASNSNVRPRRANGHAKRQKDKERKRAEEERLRAEEERLRAEEERLRAEEERLRAEEEQRLRAEEEHVAAISAFTANVAEWPPALTTCEICREDRRCVVSPCAQCPPSCCAACVRDYVEHATAPGMPGVVATVWCPSSWHADAEHGRRVVSPVWISGNLGVRFVSAVADAMITRCGHCHTSVSVFDFACNAPIHAPLMPVPLADALSIKFGDALPNDEVLRDWFNRHTFVCDVSRRLTSLSNPTLPRLPAADAFDDPGVRPRLCRWLQWLAAYQRLFGGEDAPAIDAWAKSAWAHLRSPQDPETLEASDEDMAWIAQVVQTRFVDIESIRLVLNDVLITGRDRVQLLTDMTEHTLDTVRMLERTVWLFVHDARVARWSLHLRAVFSALLKYRCRVRIFVEGLVVRACTKTENLLEWWAEQWSTLQPMSFALHHHSAGHWFDAEPTLSRSPLLADLRAYECGALPLEEFYGRVTSRYLPSLTTLCTQFNYGTFVRFVQLLRCLTNVERAGALLLRHLRSVPRFRMPCCSNDASTYCFRCQTRWHDDRRCEDRTLHEMEVECVRCPSCRVLVTKGDGCDHVRCVCSQQFNFPLLVDAKFFEEEGREVEEAVELAATIYFTFHTTSDTIRRIRAADYYCQLHTSSATKHWVRLINQALDVHPTCALGVDLVYIAAQLNSLVQTKDDSNLLHRRAFAVDRWENTHKAVVERLHGIQAPVNVGDVSCQTGVADPCARCACDLERTLEKRLGRVMRLVGNRRLGTCRASVKVRGRPPKTPSGGNNVHSLTSGNPFSLPASKLRAAAQVRVTKGFCDICVSSSDDDRATSVRVYSTMVAFVCEGRIVQHFPCRTSSALLYFSGGRYPTEVACEVFALLAAGRPQPLGAFLIDVPSRRCTLTMRAGPNTAMKVMSPTSLDYLGAIRVVANVGRQWRRDEAATWSVVGELADVSNPPTVRVPEVEALAFLWRQRFADEEAATEEVCRVWPYVCRHAWPMAFEASELIRAVTESCVEHVDCCTYAWVDSRRACCEQIAVYDDVNVRDQLAENAQTHARVLDFTWSQALEALCYGQTRSPEVRARLQELHERHIRRVYLFEAVSDIESRVIDEYIAQYDEVIDAIVAEHSDVAEHAANNMLVCRASVDALEPLWFKHVSPEFAASYWFAVQNPYLFINARDTDGTLSECECFFQHSETQVCRFAEYPDHVLPNFNV